MLQLIVYYRIASRFIHGTSQKVFAGRERQRQRQRFLFFCICGFSLSFDETWRIEGKVRAMREIVQVQVGNYANFVGAHFWNFQVQVLSLHVFFFFCGSSDSAWFFCCSCSFVRRNENEQATKMYSKSFRFLSTCIERDFKYIYGCVWNLPPEGFLFKHPKKKIENLWVRRRYHGFKRTKISYLHHPLPQIHQTQLFLDVTSLQKKTLIVNLVGLEFPGIPPAANPNCELCGSWEFPIIALAANCNVNFVDLEFQRFCPQEEECSYLIRSPSILSGWGSWNLRARRGRMAIQHRSGHGCSVQSWWNSTGSLLLSLLSPKWKEIAGSEKKFTWIYLRWLGACKYCNVRASGWGYPCNVMQVLTFAVAHWSLPIR